jgi:lipopolysaccharide/colanic/teichoic acid biosynthesis glycosyltransferase
MKLLVKRIFDIFVSLLGLIILSPLFLIIAILIVIDSKGGVFYRQLRAGLNNKGFYVMKFRTMKTGSDSKLNITIGNNDARITRIGKFIRRLKIDELPQLLNVLKGEMSLVGPRPEVPKYVAMYNEKQMKVLTVKPGITDYASIKFRNENELLARAENPEQYYIDEVMPHKLGLNLFYVKNQSLILDLKLIFKTVIFIFVKS